MSQTRRVLDYIERCGSITQMDATKDLGVMRLAARIADLKEKVVKIETVMVEGENRFGEPTKYARYYLVK